MIEDNSGRDFVWGGWRKPYEYILAEGYEGKILMYLRDGGFKKGDAWFQNGTLYVASRNLIDRAKTILKKHKDIYELPEIQTEEVESADALTEAKTSNCYLVWKERGEGTDPKTRWGVDRLRSCDDDMSGKTIKSFPTKEAAVAFVKSKGGKVIHDQGDTWNKPQRESFDSLAESDKYATFFKGEVAPMKLNKGKKYKLADILVTVKSGGELYRSGDYSHYGVSYDVEFPHPRNARSIIKGYLSMAPNGGFRLNVGGVVIIRADSGGFGQAQKTDQYDWFLNHGIGIGRIREEADALTEKSEFEEVAKHNLDISTRKAEKKDRNHNSQWGVGFRAYCRAVLRGDAGKSYVPTDAETKRGWVDARKMVAGGERIKEEVESADALTEAKEYILWAIPSGETDELHSQPIYTQGKSLQDVERVKKLAAAQGFHSFRVQVLDLSQPFDAGAAFRKAINPPSKWKRGGVKRESVEVDEATRSKRDRAATPEAQKKAGLARDMAILRRGGATPEMMRKYLANPDLWAFSNRGAHSAMHQFMLRVQQAGNLRRAAMMRSMGKTEEVESFDPLTEGFAQPTMKELLASVKWLKSILADNAKLKASGLSRADAEENLAAAEDMIRFGRKHGDKVESFDPLTEAGGGNPVEGLYSMGGRTYEVTMLKQQGLVKIHLQGDYERAVYLHKPEFDAMVKSGLKPIAAAKR